MDFHALSREMTLGNIYREDGGGLESPFPSPGLCLGHGLTLSSSHFLF